ncbi:solute carrier family 17 member 9 [Chanos chanos]|uniref:Voltage-gated purine nucleotide uniporter SLC17A9 n=1 Tax=Chanos chanos TaxID=29144 RepID=A0A6J2WAY4_CHACN|nr:solute carrier family 17 member 9-like [Chanos chanos]
MPEMRVRRSKKEDKNTITWRNGPELGMGVRMGSLTHPSQHHWPLARTWTLMLLLVTCLLYWARMAMPICAVTMATEFRWSKTQSGVVLGSFFWGYCFTQVLGGYASDRIGGERVLLLSTSAWAAMTAITPALANLGSQPLVTMTLARFLMGVLQGVHYPSLTSICAQRVVEGERGFLTSALGCGCYLGMLLVGWIGSLMLEWYGWKSVFYGAGLLSGIWAYSIWRFLLQGPLFSLELLCSNCVAQTRPLNTKWMNLFKHPCVWAMGFAHLCFNSSYFCLMSWLPTFFKETFPQAKGWVFNVIPWLVAIPSSLFGGSVSDYLIKNGFAVVVVRKSMQFCAMGIGSVFIFLLSKTDSFFTAMICVSTAVGLSTFNNSGVGVNVHDLAPSCAGALFGVMNTCAAFTGLLVVYISGYLIEVTGSWTAVFSLLFWINILGFVTFLVFGKAQRVDQDHQSHVTNS